MVEKGQVIAVVIGLKEEVIRNREGETVGVMSLFGSGKGEKLVIRERCM